MKIYISADMEGITGVSGAQHMKGSEYERMRHLLTNDINAAIEGASEGGASEIWVNDAHALGTNILIEELNPAAELICGWNTHLCQMAEFDASFDAVFFIGYHGHEGHGDAVLSHTIASNIVSEIKCNGTVFGEVGINAGIAGYFGVPVVLVVGDQIVCDEATDLLGAVETVRVKHALDRQAARLIPPKKSSLLIRNAARRALERLPEIDPFEVTGDVEFTVTTKRSTQAHMAALFPTIERVGPNIIKIQSNDYIEAFKQVWGCIIVGMGTGEI